MQAKPNMAAPTVQDGRIKTLDNNKSRALATRRHAVAERESAPREHFSPRISDVPRIPAGNRNSNDAELFLPMPSRIEARLNDFIHSTCRHLKKRFQRPPSMLMNTHNQMILSL